MVGGNLKTQEEKQKLGMKTNTEGEDTGGEACAQEEAPLLYKCLANITKEICELKEDMRRDIMALNANFRQEFANFKEDINNKLKANNDELQGQNKSLREAHVSRSWRRSTWRLKKHCY